MRDQLIDQHVHTNHSPDAQKDATMEAYIAKAKTMGKAGVIFTDHYDTDTPVALFETLPDYDAYTEKIKRLDEKDFFVRMGVEIGYQAGLEAKLSAFLNRHPFDFVICSLHLGDGLDFYNGDFFKGKTQKEAYRRYFELVLDSVRRYDNYDVYGHLDYINRYGGYTDKRLDYENYKDLIDPILRTLVEKGKGLEINTSGLRYGLGASHPGLAILKRFKALGGTIITIGSDAHRCEDFYAGFNEAKRLIREAGFDRVAVFKNRKPTFVRLG